MSYLVVVAHPDDEVLGAGATISKLTKEGKEVNVCIMSGKAQARTRRPQDFELEEDTKNALDMLGVNKRIIGDFPNIKFNQVAHLELVRHIEKAIEETGADIIITHHPADTNNDHYHTSIACQAAIRLFQRRENERPLREVLFMEVLSSTEWSINTANRAFSPNTFVEVGAENIDLKIRVLETYRNVMRPFPHPRSKETIEGLAAYRGGQSGCKYAEAFESVFRRIF